MKQIILKHEVKSINEAIEALIKFESAKESSRGAVNKRIEITIKKGKTNKKKSYIKAKNTKDIAGNIVVKPSLCIYLEDEKINNIAMQLIPTTRRY